MKSKYEITTETYHNKVYLWDPIAEIKIAELAKRLHELNPKLSWNMVCIELLTKYLQKREGSSISPTKLMRAVIGKM